jgi:hypothetical protein
MANRVIRDGILDSERVNKLSCEAELFYRRLMSIVDDFGRGDGRIQILRSKLYPLKLDQVTEKNVIDWMKECVQVGLIMTYVVDKKPYLEMLDFNQSVRIKRSKYPANPNVKADEIICIHNESTSMPETNPILSEKKQDIETRKDFEEERLKLIDQWLKDLPNSTHLERISSLTGISKQVLIQKIPDFRKKLRFEYKNQSDFLDHFKNWSLQQNEQLTPEPLKTTVTFGKKK